MSRFTFVSIVAAASFAAACSSNGSDHQITAAEYDDVAQHVGSTTSTGSGGGEVGSMHDAIALSAGTIPLGLSLDAHGHINGSRLGLSYDYTVACKDASGAALPACNDTADQADVQVAWSGNLALPNLTATIDRHGSWHLSGLRTSAIHLAGDGSFTFDSDVKSIFRQGDEATYHLATDATYDDVVLNADHAPVSGSIHYTIAAKHTTTVNGSTTTDDFDVDADVTFTGDGKATLVLDGSQHYTIDLATGAVVHA